jgi:hypothetical protein
MMAAKNKLTEGEREQRRAEDRERLKAAAEQLLSSQGWQRWVRVRVRSRNGLARYCFLISRLSHFLRAWVVGGVGLSASGGR